MRRPSERTVKILKGVALGVFLIGIGAVPPPWAIPRIIRELTSNDTPQNRAHTRRRFYDLKRTDYIKTGAKRYEITEKGKRVLDDIELWNLKLKNPKRWSGEWHLVAFDIPSKNARVRIKFIRLLQNLGLIFYQRSVWIYPHPVEDCVRRIARHFGIEPHVSFITASKVGGSAQLKRKFEIQ